ncbi:MAG: phospho-N-acetylmuramoyl-pentapeptide-transferase [Clostridia bacterium]|nr:phospho-N-acetylmuramoyl-pentapeptide-transferase [Clostridia bacterium]
MQRVIWAVLLSCGAVLALGPLAIKALQKLKLGQNIYEYAPDTHKQKQGTPTMGGLLFALASCSVAAILKVGFLFEAGDLLLALTAFSVFNLLIGFLDDMVKIRGKRNQGLSEKHKILAQLLVAAAFTAYCYTRVGSTVYIPFFGFYFDLGIFYIPLMIFIIVCTTNGANLLDGLDGLLAGVSAVVTAFFAILILLFTGALSGISEDNMINVAVLCAAVCGSLLGYLRFNLHPAQIMMGDTGSMFLGGIAVGAAMLMRVPLIIPIAAGAYAISLLSVFLQRIYYRATHGKRIFKMSPLHHHFELCGVPETRIVSMYAIVTVLLCLFALLGVMNL